MTLTLSLIALLVAIITCATAIASLRTSVMGLRTSRDNKEKIKEVYVHVNSQFSAAMARIDQLTHTLERADVEVPKDPNPKAS